MGGFLIRLVICGLALWVASFIVNLVAPGGMTLTDQVPDIIYVVLIFGVVNALVKPIVSALTCPINFLTLGLFTFVVNALMLMLTSYLAQSVSDSAWLTFDGFWPALLAGIVVSIVSTVLSVIVSEG